jgi:hypothetical protein
MAGHMLGVDAATEIGLFLCVTINREWNLGIERQRSTGYEHIPLEWGVGTDHTLPDIAATQERGA